MRLLAVLAIVLPLGTHTVAARPTRSKPRIDVTGVYQSNWDEVRLEQTRNRVVGEYVCCGGGVIEGHIDGRFIHYRWSQGDGGEGRGVWEVVSRDELRGTWGSGDSEDDGGDWNLTRTELGAIAN